MQHQDREEAHNLRRNELKSFVNDYALSIMSTATLVSSSREPVDLLEVDIPHISNVVVKSLQSTFLCAAISS